MPRKRKQPIVSTTYEQKMAEVIAEYQAWLKTKKRVSVKKILDYTLPSGSIA